MIAVLAAAILAFFLHRFGALVPAAIARLSIDGPLSRTDSGQWLTRARPARLS